MWRTAVHTMSTASPLLLENIYLLINFVSDVGTELVEGDISVYVKD